jgi:hypothetical protein
MGAQIATQAILILLGNLPAAYDTATKVFAFVSTGIASITAAVGDKDVTDDELLALVRKEAENYAKIMAIP